MFKKWLILNEVVDVKKPGKVSRRNIKKNAGTWQEKSALEYRFKTKLGNEVKLHFEKIEENGYDVMFYVNDTQHDSATGGRDSDVLSNVIWLIRNKADQLKANLITFTAQIGEGDRKIVRGLDTNNLKSLMIAEINKVRAEINNYKVNFIKRNPSVWIKLNKPIPPDYPDLDKNKYLDLLSSYESGIDDEISFVSLVYNTIYYFQELSKLGIDSKNFVDIAQKLSDAIQSNTQQGFLQHRNRREVLWEKLAIRNFPDWNLEKNGVKFKLTRKNPI